MFDRNRTDIPRRPKKESLQMCIGTLIFNRIIPNKFFNHPKARCLQILRLFQKNPHRQIIDIAAEIPEFAVLLVRVVAIHNIMRPFLKLFQ